MIRSMNLNFYLKPEVNYPLYKRMYLNLLNSYLQLITEILQLPLTNLQKILY
jgi:hypothetical protein